VRCEVVNNGLSNPLPADDAFLATMQLLACPEHELWLDGQSMPTAFLPVGAMSIYDLRADPRVNSVSPFFNVHFHIPRKVLNAIADEDGRASIDLLPHEPGLGFQDQILQGLTFALQPAFEHPERANTLFVDHVTQALAGHVTYLFAPRIKGAGKTPKLSESQARRLKEKLAANLTGRLSLKDLAVEVGISTRDVARAFVNATGKLPHQWLLQQRVEKAIDLLSVSHLPVADVAVTCGFIDVGHMDEAIARTKGFQRAQVRA
jgi:AraC-like DNA-binding protein